MDFLTGLGAAGQGVSLGLQDVERMDDAKFRKDQQARQKADWATDDKIKEGAAAVDPNLTGSKRAAALAAVYAQNGRTKDALALQQQAMQFDRDEMEMRRSKLAEGVMNAQRLHSLGNNAGAMQALQQAYDLYPDNHKIVLNPDNTFGVAGPDAKWAVPPVAMSNETVRAALDKAMMFGAPQMWSLYRKADNEERQLKQGDRKIEIAQQSADDDRTYRTGVLGLQRDELAAKAPLLRAQADYYGRMPKEGGGGAAGTAVQRQREGVAAYAEALFKSGKAKTPEEAERMAWGAALKDPNNREQQPKDSGLSEQGLFRVAEAPGRLFRMGPKGVEEVKLPGGSAIDKLLQDPSKLEAAFSDKKQPAPAAKPTAAAQPQLGLQAPSGVDKGIYEALTPLADDYKQALARYQAAAKSGDAKVLRHYEGPLQAAREKLESQVQQRLGNGAARFYQSQGLN